jgi:gamma-glutamyl:cysteine ligase YbdK (ATP-grasp superfamily)
MEKEKPVFHCLERIGIEIEYMIVDRAGLAVKPIADQLIKAASGAYKNEIHRGPISWSNELALHLIELKCTEPAATLEGLDALFLENIKEANRLLEEDEAHLLGSGMHPFMNPHGETKLWPHKYHTIYSTFDRIFSCSRHGWSNLQSTHINCSFFGDEEFGRLHAAIRLVLPIIPALAASSPLIENRISGFLDTRMEVYRSNSMRVPIVTGDVIPEPVFSRDEYKKHILEPIYFELAPHDPEEILRDEWVNARGAIARFDRDAVEIRVVDAQETPKADLAVASAIIGVIKCLTAEQWSSLDRQKTWAVDPLKKILLDATKSGEKAVITDRDYLATLGYTGESCTAQDLWKHLVAQVEKHYPALIAPYREPIEYILQKGTLASRILTALEHRASWKTIDVVYKKLAECLPNGEML